jgi:hypothetical protein
MIHCNLQDDGSSHNGPLFGHFESMRVVPRVPIHVKLASTSCSISGAIGVCTITRTHGKSRRV